MAGKPRKNDNEPKMPFDPHMEAVIMRILADGTVVYRMRKRGPDGKEYSKVFHPKAGMTDDEIYGWLLKERKDFLASIGNPTGPVTSRSTLSEYFDDAFIRKRRLTVREKTVFDYIAIFDRHARNDIGGREIGSITKLDLMEFYNRLSRNGVGPGSIQVLHRILRATFASALEDDVVYKNIAAGKDVAPRKKAPQGKALSEVEVLRFQECVEKEPAMWRTLFNLMLHTGCRRGEIAGLRWEDVDFIESVIQIRHSLVYTPGVGLILGDAKSEMSNRKIPIMHDDRAALYAMHETCGKGYVFTCCEDPETPLFPDTISSHLSYMCKKNGIAHISPHMLRRTLPTILITRYNVDPKTLQCILGHSNVSTTLGYYTMVDADQSRRTLEMYGNIINGSSDEEEAKPDQKTGSAKRSPRKKKDDSDSVEYLKIVPGSEDLSFVIGGKDRR